MPDLPYVPGSDASGYVESVGSNVTSLYIGQRVFVTGKNSGENRVDMGLVEAGIQTAGHFYVRRKQSTYSRALKSERDRISAHQ